jgi:hypothetical protein
MENWFIAARQFLAGHPWALQAELAERCAIDDRRHALEGQRLSAAAARRAGSEGLISVLAGHGSLQALKDILGLRQGQPETVDRGKVSTALDRRDTLSLMLPFDDYLDVNLHALAPSRKSEHDLGSIWADLALGFGRSCA